MMNLLILARRALLGLGLIGLAQTALASNVTITAKYLPSLNNTRFENTTPLGGFCRRWPSVPECTGSNHSVDLGIQYNKTTIRNAPDVRDRYWVSLPGLRKVQVSSASGDVHELQFSMSKFSAYVGGGGSDYPTPIWTIYVAGGCSYIRSLGSSVWAVGLWNVIDPKSPQPCHSTSDGGPTDGTPLEVSVDEFSVGYILETPDPLAMRSGTYRGSLTYSVGENGDISLGNGVSALNTSSVTLNFELEVLHALILEFPANSDQVRLEPRGGWLRWLSGGPPPSVLERDLPFRIWSSGPLSIYTDCEFPMANRCGIRNTRTGHTVPLDVLVTLPGGMQQGGMPVRRAPVPSGRGIPLVLESVNPVLNQPGALHFATAPGVVAEMVQNPGDTYRGNVTVVFDAEL